MQLKAAYKVAGGRIKERWRQDTRMQEELEAG
jgi:hypothetical protein